MPFFFFRGPFLESPVNFSDPQRHFFVNPDLKMERCIRLKLLVWREPLLILIRWLYIKQLCNRKVRDFATVFRMRKLFGTFEKRAPGHCTPLVPVADSDKRSRDDKHLLVTGPYSLQQSCYKFLGGSKFGAIHAMDFAIDSSSRDHFSEAGE